MEIIETCIYSDRDRSSALNRKAVLHGIDGSTVGGTVKDIKATDEYRHAKGLYDTLVNARKTVAG